MANPNHLFERVRTELGTTDHCDKGVGDLDLERPLYDLERIWML